MADFPYIPMPKAFWDPQKPYNLLSIEAKVTLSKLLQLKDIAKWYNPPQVDEDGMVYVTFTRAQVQSLVGCKDDKAGKILMMLSDHGYIRRIHQGQGKPDRIYVRDLDLGHFGHDDKTQPQRVGPAEHRRQLMDQINYDRLTTEFEVDIIDSIVKVIVDKLQTQNKVVTIVKDEYDGDYVRQQLLSTQETDIRYVIRRLKGLKEPPHAPSAYILARLWESYDGATVFKRDKTASYNVGYNVPWTSRISYDEIEDIRRLFDDDTSYGDPF